MSDPIPNTSGIYKITCTATGKIYIGSALNLRRRITEHLWGLRRNKHHNPKLQSAWNKYGEQAFTFEVLELVLEINRDAREQYWFNKLKPFDEKGYNIAREAGISFGGKPSPEAIEKGRQAQLGKKVSPETRERMRQAHLGNKNALGYKHTPGKMRGSLSPEHREKLRQAKLGKKQSPEHIEKVKQARLGKKVSPETREKIRQARLGKKRSPETIEKMIAPLHTPEARERNRQALIGRKQTPEHIERNRQAQLAYWAKKRQADGDISA